MKESLKSANPYLPLWEHVPDGEPRVFEYNGERRLYVYGSHDTERSSYCGRDYVVWSAPVDDLTDWTYHGVLLHCHRRLGSLCAGRSAKRRHFTSCRWGNNHGGLVEINGQ